MRLLALLSLLTLLVLTWNGWYATQGTSSMLAKDGGLKALHEWKERGIDDEA